MPRFTVEETAFYAVEAATEEEALEKFTNGDIRSFPCSVDDRTVYRDYSDEDEEEDDGD